MLGRWLPRKALPCQHEGWRPGPQYLYECQIGIVACETSCIGELGVRVRNPASLYVVESDWGRNRMSTSGLHTHMHRHAYIPLHLYPYTCIYTSLPISTYMHIHLSTYINIHSNTPLHIYQHGGSEPTTVCMLTCLLSQPGIVRVPLVTSLSSDRGRAILTCMLANNDWEKARQLSSFLYNG